MKNLKIIEAATTAVGYIESPANSNNTKFGKWFGLNGVAWCGIFVSWCYAQAGLELGNLGFLKGFAGCQSAVAYFTKNKMLTENPLPGDIVFFDWNGDGRYDHTGLYVKKLNETQFETIEGNTSLTNQSNGGSVMRRTRNTRNVLFVHPAVLN